jgi:hypothetical protein
VPLGGTAKWTVEFNGRLFEVVTNFDLHSSNVIQGQDARTCDCCQHRPGGVRVPFDPSSDRLCALTAFPGSKTAFPHNNWYAMWNLDT